MSRRLQVVLGDDEARRFQEAADVTGLTLSDWVRRSLRRAELEVSTGDPDHKLSAIRAAAAHRFPVPDGDDTVERSARRYPGQPE